MLFDNIKIGFIKENNISRVNANRLKAIRTNVDKKVKLTNVLN
jgi:hypothetical protein